MERLVIEKVLSQHSSNNILEDYVEISVKDDFKINNNELYKIINYDSIDKNKNGSHFIIKGSHIKKVDGNNNTISLNRKQRTLLNIEQFKIDDRNTAKSDVYKICIEEYPVKNGNIIKVICDKVLERVLVFFVGKKNIILAVKRPYTVDESFNLVRLSANSMKILGLKDMDRVNITYGSNSISVNALTINDKESFKMCNQDTLDKELTKEELEKHNVKNKYCLIDENYCVLMPIHLRQKLFQSSYEENRQNVIINTCVKVERDNKYIFIKGLYKQLIPLILAIFSLFKIMPIFMPIFNDAILVAVVSIIGAIFTLYLNLAEERNVTR